jgi:hypothetical protein
VRARAGAALAAVTLALAGCGGDDEEDRATTATGGATATVETTETTEATAPPVETTTDELGTATPDTEPATSPEDAPGGAGDEEPAATQALFTAEGGRITPRVVRVPAFIAVRAVLRSADGREYALRFGDETLRAGGRLESVSTLLDGLRPGDAIVGVPVGAGNRVRIEATAEPGP